MRKISTDSYNSELNELCKNEDRDVYIKVKLIKRVTYGEYVGEPKNGFALEIEKGKTDTFNLDNADVYLDEDNLSTAYKHLARYDDIFGGRAVVKNTRIEPRHVVGYGSIEEIEEDFNLTKEQILECYHYESLKNLGGYE